MGRQLRRDCVDPNKIQLLHCYNRVVRQAYLFGFDDYSQTDYSHRRLWMQDRMKLLETVFGIDLVTYAILSTHFHVILRSRPDVVAQWSAEEVAKQWWNLYPQRKNKDGTPKEPTAKDLRPIAKVPKKLAEIRTRLSDVSWWMKALAEPIARRANKEDGVKGKFWEARFGSEEILDEMGLLACSIYVDLNLVRAAMAATPEDSMFTGANDRIEDLKANGKHILQHFLSQWERDPARKRSGWLAPIEFNGAYDIGPVLDKNGRRPSQKGCFNMTVTDYLEILDWTGRLVRKDKRGSIPSSLKPILQRIGLKQSGWGTLIDQFGKLYKRVIGTADSIAKEATRRGQNYMHAPALKLFS